MEILTRSSSPNILHVNIETIGHLDHGKTTLTPAIITVWQLSVNFFASMGFLVFPIVFLNEFLFEQGLMQMLVALNHPMWADTSASDNFFENEKGLLLVLLPNFIFF